MNKPLHLEKCRGSLMTTIFFSDEVFNVKKKVWG
ncbi:hypothetical protein SAMN06265218_101421 [Fodinibius sediminis]|uniref:Uncharacterized protein n=1 Tax=Fodinibius sediminis TaxID=1214077 RepID=A0A521AWI1_9BACT|nr:hypothetical protein SAMN06265218_101421 [Fodinibius sediminis]